MPHTIIWESEGLYREFTGEISGDEILESNLELHIHPDFQSIKYIINDFTKVTTHSIEINHTKAYATTDKVISNSKGRLKIAIVVVNDSLIDLAQGYREQMLESLFECEIFKALESARSWTSIQQ